MLANPDADCFEPVACTVPRLTSCFTNKVLLTDRHTPFCIIHGHLGATVAHQDNFGGDPKEYVRNTLLPPRAETVMQINCPVDDWLCDMPASWGGVGRLMQRKGSDTRKCDFCQPKESICETAVVQMCQHLAPGLGILVFPT